MNRPPPDEGFLNRWSRRKQAIREGDDAGLDPDPADLENAAGPAESEGDAPADPVEAARLEQLQENREAAEAVDLETLDYESDYKVFLKEGVPEALKNAALRKLWRSNPILAVRDGLNDYDVDFNVTDKILKEFQSAWQVGRGYKDKAQEVLEEMEAKSAALAEEREAAALAAKEDAARDEASPDQVAEDAEPGHETANADMTQDVNEGLLDEAGEAEEPVRPRVSIRDRLGLDAG